jgi:hypothetical protein
MLHMHSHFRNFGAFNTFARAEARVAESTTPSVLNHALSLVTLIGKRSVERVQERIEDAQGNGVPPFAQFSGQ